MSWSTGPALPPLPLPLACSLPIPEAPPAAAPPLLRPPLDSLGGLRGLARVRARTGRLICGASPRSSSPPRSPSSARCGGQGSRARAGGGEDLHPSPFLQPCPRSDSIAPSIILTFLPRTRAPGSVPPALAIPALARWDGSARDLPTVRRRLREGAAAAPAVRSL